MVIAEFVVFREFLSFFRWVACGWFQAISPRVLPTKLDTHSVMENGSPWMSGYFLEK